MSQPVLSLPRREGKFRVETDASEHAIRGVLSQEQDGKWKPIVSLSRTIQPAERNYKIYDKELLCHKSYSACISTTGGPIFTN